MKANKIQEFDLFTFQKTEENQEEFDLMKEEFLFNLKKKAYLQKKLKKHTTQILNDFCSFYREFQWLNRKGFPKAPKEERFGNFTKQIKKYSNERSSFVSIVITHPFLEKLKEYRQLIEASSQKKERIAFIQNMKNEFSSILTNCSDEHFLFSLNEALMEEFLNALSEKEMDITGIGMYLSFVFISALIKAIAAEKQLRGQRKRDLKIRKIEKKTERAFAPSNLR